MPIIIMANGPSLRRYDWTRVEPSWTIMGLNRSWEVCWPTWHLALEHVHAERFPGVYRELARQGRLIGCGCGWPEGTEVISLGPPDPEAKRGLFLAEEFGPFNEGWDGHGSVAYVALQYAVSRGYRKIHFAGLDMRGAHFWGGSDGPEERFAKHQEFFHAAAEALEGTGVEVYVNPESYCEAFPRKELPVPKIEPLTL